MYLVFKAEMQQFLTENRPYERSAIEWELLGDLCRRLHRNDDAKMCYQQMVNVCFSFRVWFKLFWTTSSDDKVHLVLTALEKMAGVLDRWKNDQAFTLFWR